MSDHLQDVKVEDITVSDRPPAIPPELPILPLRDTVLFPNSFMPLAVARETLPDDLEVTAWTDDGEIMGFQHKSRPVHGVQFHPESIATAGGHDLLANFLDLAGVTRAAAV